MAVMDKTNIIDFDVLPDFDAPSEIENVHKRMSEIERQLDSDNKSIIEQQLSVFKLIGRKFTALFR